jgi:2-oxoglutarate dehydrogenase complex dihydrolipoamide succinyltransferase (E2) component
LVQYEFKLPDIGEGVAEGEILKWLVKEGETVKEDQSLVEVMTDKVNVQIPSPKDGTIAKILVKEGDVVKVGRTIVVIEFAGSAPAAPAPSEPRSQPAPVQTAPAAQVLHGPALQDRVLAAPATRRLARELGIDITSVKGTGPNGRVTDDDLRAGPPAVADAPKAPAAVSGNEERVPLRGVRKVIAERMAKSFHTIAQVTLVDEVDMTELVLLREAFKGSAEKRGVKLTFLPFVIKAVIPALKEFPYVNSTLDEGNGEIVLKKRYNLGIATDTPNGLLVPVLKDVDEKDIFELSAEIEKLAAMARTGELGRDEVQGSTFTITNLGSIGGLFATPIVNYPEVAILGTHRISKRPVVRDGKIEARDMMYLSLSFDHRVMDGAYGARFMNRIIDIIQDPKKILSEIL